MREISDRTSIINKETIIKYSIELQLIYHCAPVLKGIKAANTITLPYPMLASSRHILYETDIRLHVLFHNNLTAIVLLYRLDRLQKVLNQVAYCSYLLELGYRPLRIEECLGELRRKMHDYHRNKRLFPHELGVFLEYPLYDIKAFMKQGGKNSIYCGYWKVYEKEEWARQIFMTYDLARNELLSKYKEYGKLIL